MTYGGQAVVLGNEFIHRERCERMPVLGLYYVESRKRYVVMTCTPDDATPLMVDPSDVAPVMPPMEHIPARLLAKRIAGVRRCLEWLAAGRPRARRTQ